MTATHNSEAFARALELHAKRQTDELAPVFVKKTVLDLFVAIASDTRSDTGRARANWQFGFDGVPGEVLEEKDPGEKGSPPEATIAREAAKLDAYRLGQTIWIVNNVHYIVWLEEGTNKMRGDHMVATALASIGGNLEAQL